MITRRNKTLQRRQNVETTAGNVGGPICLYMLAKVADPLAEEHPVWSASVRKTVKQLPDLENEGAQLCDKR